MTKRVYHGEGMMSLYRWNWGVEVGGIVYSRGWTLIVYAPFVRVHYVDDGAMIYSTDGVLP